MPTGVYNHHKITVPREVRTCPTCSTIFECRLKSKQKYCNRYCYSRSLVGRSISKETIEKCLATKRTNGTLRPKKRTKKKIAMSVKKHWEEVDKEVRCTNMKGKKRSIPPWNKLLRETRMCANVNCFTTFEVPINSTQRFCSHVCVNTCEEIGRRRGKKISTSAKKLWQDFDYRKKQLKAHLRNKQNKTERLLEEILYELFPGEYKFVGDGQFILAGKCPDFININGQKKIIELFGNYYHSEEITGISEELHEQNRKDLFARYGYQSLIVWEHELKDNSRLTNKLVEFNNV